jgi:hypothetical protein
MKWLKISEMKLKGSTEVVLNHLLHNDLRNVRAVDVQHEHYIISYKTTTYASPFSTDAINRTISW